jgi:hypothetical protein
VRNKIISVAAAFVLAGSAQAAIVNIDISAAGPGTIVTGVGASFAQTFAGQSVMGTGVVGSPTGPLALQAAGTITTAFFAPGVSPAGNSLLSQPNNQGPLAVLLGSLGNSFTFTMGSSDAGSSINYSFFGANGGLVGGGSITMLSGYNIYTIANAAAFRGIGFADNNDGAGVRFMNMSFNSVDTPVVPEPSTWAMMIAGFGLVGAVARRRIKTAVA